MENQITPLTFPGKNGDSDYSGLKAGHVAIRTTEYAQLIEWYKETLDFRVVREWTVGDLQLAFLALPNDDSFLIEVLGNQATEEQGVSKMKWGYDHVCFHVEDLDKTVAALSKRNVTITRSMRIPAIGKRVAFIADPFGNTIEFCAELK